VENLEPDFSKGEREPSEGAIVYGAPTFTAVNSNVYALINCPGIALRVICCGPLFFFFLHSILFGFRFILVADVLQFVA